VAFLLPFVWHILGVSKMRQQADDAFGLDDTE
jgi:hypothetical protein